MRKPLPVSSTTTAFVLSLPDSDCFVASLALKLEKPYIWYCSSSRTHLRVVQWFNLVPGDDPEVTIKKSRLRERVPPRIEERVFFLCKISCAESAYRYIACVRTQFDANRRPRKENIELFPRRQYATRRKECTVAGRGEECPLLGGSLRSRSNIIAVQC